jgi:hypothetical protein
MLKKIPSSAFRFGPASGVLAATALSGIVYMSPVEFADLQRLPNAERRVRLGMPDTCRPKLSALKVSKKSSGRMAVLVSCDPRRTPATEVPPR